MPRLELRWDDEQKTWYLPEGVERIGFEQCLPTPRAANQCASDWFLAGRKKIAEILQDLS